MGVAHWGTSSRVVRCLRVRPPEGVSTRCRVFVGSEVHVLAENLVQKAKLQHPQWVPDFGFSSRLWPLTSCGTPDEHPLSFRFLISKARIWVVTRGRFWLC